MELSRKRENERSFLVRDRFHQREGFTKSQRGPRKVSMESRRNSNQSYFRHNKLVRKKRWDPHPLDKIDHKKEKVGPRNGTKSIHFLNILHTDNKQFGQFRVQRNDINQSCQQKVMKSIVHLE
jgi:hypothetical protein